MSCNLQQQIINTYYTDYKFFFSKPNVVGVAYGYKYINKINTFEPSIHVLVKKKLSSNCLSSNCLIPSLYKGIKTDVIETGSFTSSPLSNLTSNNLNNSSIPLSNETFCSSQSNISAPPGPYTGRIRPIQPGYSMSINAPIILPPLTGTFGYIVLDNEQTSKTYCLLSNNWTFADLNRAPIGTKIIQPSYAYGGRGDENVVAKLLRYSPIKFTDIVTPPPLREFNIIDASVASLFSTTIPGLINPFIPPNFLIPRGISTPRLHQTVQWTGCRSGYQRGQVLSLSAVVEVGYPRTGIAWFKDSIIINGIFAEYEDYGALVCDLNRNAIGLLFQYSEFIPSNDGPYNLICPIQPVLDTLNVTLVTQ